MPSGYSLYEVLGIERTADQRQIRAAFSAAIKQCHPDVASAPNAHDATIALIDAYSVLGDADRRFRYDAELRAWEDSLVEPDWQPDDGRDAEASSPADQSAPSSAHAAAPDDPLVPDAHAPAPGVHAASSRAEAAPPEQQTHDWAARTAAACDAQTAPDSAPQPEAADAANSQVPRSAADDEAALRAPSRWSRQVFAAAAVTLVLAIITGMMTVVFFTQRSSLGAAPAPEHAAEVAAAQRDANDQGWLSPCLDDSGIGAQQLYEQCVRVRVRLHGLMMQARGPAQMDEYKLQDALAEMRQAVGAAELRMSSTPGFVQESVASLEDIRKSATTDRVRRLADTYYSCYALKRCAP